MPLLGGDRSIHIFDGEALTFLHVIKRHVVFKRVGTSNVILVAVLEAPDDTASLICPTRQRFELDFDKAVGDLRRLPYTPRKGAAPGLLQNIWTAWCGSVSFNFPNW